MKRIPCPLFAASFFLLSSPAFAQVPPAPQHAPDGGTHETFASITIPSTPNAPFAATVNTEWIRQTPDGSNITLINHRTIARDSQGRIFQERAWFVPNDGKHQSTAYQIEISDPVAHERYVCRIAEHVCRLEQFFAPKFAVSRTAAASPGQPGAPAAESLGTQNVSGLETIGTRETTLVEIQTIGNDAPILERKEFWYSPQLGVNLITKRQDARFATQQNFEVTNIALGEPDAHVLEVPAGYKILDLRKPPEISPKPDTSQN
ncbi:MAG: hypothetical protein WBE73_04955 [Candidatus Acidiferrum sp.]